MTAIVGRQLDHIRASGVVPEGFAGTMHAHDQVLASLGFTVPASQTDARAVVASHDAHLAETHSAETHSAETHSAETRTVAPRAAPLPTVPNSGGRLDSDAPAHAPDPEVVRRASLVFQNALSRDIRNLDVVVTKGDLDRITETVRSLSPENARAVYDTLSAPDRQRWAAELTADYTPAERSELYGLLAERFDGPHLLSFAYYNEHAGSTGVDGRLFGEAVAARASEAVTEAFVRNAAAYTVPPEARGMGPQASHFEARTEIGAAAAGALTGLRGPALDRALSTLERSDRLGSVVTRSVHIETVPNVGGGPPSLLFNADTLGGLLRTASTSQDGRARATLVDEASRMLGRIEGAGGPGVIVARGDSVDQIRDGVTAVLQRDPVGVMRTYSDVLAPMGERHLPGYLASMIGAGQSAEVGHLLARLGTGDGVAQTSAEWATTLYPDKQGRPYFANAEMVGYAVGSVVAAIEARSQDRREQGELLDRVFGGAAAGIGAIPHPAARTVAAVLTGLSSVSVDAVVTQHTESSARLARQVWDLSYPTDENGDPVTGDARGAFSDGFGQATNVHLE